MPKRTPIPPRTTWLISAQMGRAFVVETTSADLIAAARGSHSYSSPMNGQGRAMTYPARVAGNWALLEDAAKAALPATLANPFTCFYPCPPALARQAVPWEGGAA